jgi:hypothetical protein
VHSPVLYLPVLTTLLALGFAWVVFQRYRRKERAYHLLWWSAGIFLYGVGTSTEAFVAIFGWEAPVFRAWYISGALLGGAPLAQGTVYLLLERRTAHRLAIALVAFVAIAALFVILTPVDASLAEEHRLSGKVIEWEWVRFFSPFVNTYAFIFLVGGAIASARHYAGDPATRDRFVGNVCIAVGAVLPGIGGSFTRAGYTDVLYVTELIGIIFIYAGFRLNTRSRPTRVPSRESAPAEAARLAKS